MQSGKWDGCVSTLKMEHDTVKKGGNIILFNRGNGTTLLRSSTDPSQIFFD